MYNIFQIYYSSQLNWLLWAAVFPLPSSGAQIGSCLYQAPLLSYTSSPYFCLFLTYYIPVETMKNREKQHSPQPAVPAVMASSML